MKLLYAGVVDVAVSLVMANLDTGGGGLLGGLGCLGGGDLGCDNRSGGGSGDGQGGQCAGQEPCSRVPRVSCARSTRSH